MDKKTLKWTEEGLARKATITGIKTGDKKTKKSQHSSKIDASGLYSNKLAQSDPAKGGSPFKTKDWKNKLWKKYYQDERMGILPDSNFRLANNKKFAKINSMVVLERAKLTFVNTSNSVDIFTKDYGKIYSISLLEKIISGICYRQITQYDQFIDTDFSDYSITAFVKILIYMQDGTFDSYYGRIGSFLDKYGIQLTIPKTLTQKNQSTMITIPHN